jgi:hypothetical protein
MIYDSPTSVIHNLNHSKIENDQKSEPHSSSPSFQNLNDPVLIHDNLLLNPLAMSLSTGNHSHFKYLIEKACASPKLMEKLLRKQGISGINLIIETGSLELFKYYLPIFLLDYKNSNYLQKPLLHQAIALGRLEIVSFAFSYFSMVDAPPAFDMHFIDKETGENSALIACRSSNLEIIQFLNEVCLVDFGLINFKRENALMIFVQNAEIHGFDERIWKYLVEKCEVDVVWNFYQVLACLDDERVFKEFCEELGKYGCRVCGEEVFRVKGEKFYQNQSEDDITAMSCISYIDDEDFSESRFDESFYFTRYLNN